MGGSVSVSADGRYVAFESLASNLVDGDTNGVSDVFVKDTATDAVLRASTAAGGVQANNGSFLPSISPDGRFVTFSTLATNLVAADTSRNYDVLMKDLETGAVTLISATADGLSSNGDSFASDVSEGGLFVAFSSDASDIVPVEADSGNSDLFLRDTAAGATTHLTPSVTEAAEPTEADGHSAQPSISDDGSVVAFASQATDLVADDGNDATDVFVHSVGDSTTVRASVSNLGFEGLGSSQRPSLSGDGTVVAFDSAAPNLVLLDLNFSRDVFVHDLGTGETVLVSAAGPLGQSASGHSVGAALSADGGIVAFESDATNLTGAGNGLDQVYVQDLASGETSLVSCNARGVAAVGQSGRVALTSDGQGVSFYSDAEDLVPDANSQRDAFLSSSRC